MDSIFADLIEEVVEWCTEKKDLQNLDAVLERRMFAHGRGGVAYRIHITHVSSVG